MEPRTDSLSTIPGNAIASTAAHAVEPDVDTMRVNMYRLLAVLLSAPVSAELLDTLRSIDDTGTQRDDDMARAWKTLRLASTRATLESVDDEYHDLFIGVGRGEVVPYGSWYQTGFLLDRPLVYLRRDLAMLGFERQEGTHEPEDHISALCETMSLMAADENGIALDVQRNFFHDHLDPWVQRFFLDLQRARAAHFYAAVGELGERYIDIEKRYLEMLG